MIPKYTLKQVFKHTLKTSSLQQSVAINNTAIRTYSLSDEEKRREEIRKKLSKTSLSFNKNTSSNASKQPKTNATRPKNTLKLNIDNSENKPTDSFEERRNVFLNKLKPLNSSDSGYKDLKSKLRAQPNIENHASKSIFSRPNRNPQFRPGKQQQKSDGTERKPSNLADIGLDEKAVPQFLSKESMHDQISDMYSNEEANNEPDTKKNRMNRLVKTIATSLSENAVLHNQQRFQLTYESTLDEQMDQNFTTFKTQRTTALRGLKKYVEAYEKRHNYHEVNPRDHTKPITSKPNFKITLNKHGENTNNSHTTLAGLEANILQTPLHKTFEDKKVRYIVNEDNLLGLSEAFNTTKDPKYLKLILVELKLEREIHRLENTNGYKHLRHIFKVIKRWVPNLKPLNKSETIKFTERLIDEKLEKLYDQFFTEHYGTSQGRLDNRILAAVKKDLIDSGLREELASLGKESKESQHFELLMQKHVGNLNQYTDPDHIGVLTSHGGNHHISTQNHAMIHRERMLDTLSKRAKRLERQPMPFHEDTESLYQIRRTGKYAIRAPLLRYVQPYLDKIPEGTAARQRIESHAGVIMKNKGLSLSEKIKGVAFLVRVYERFNLPKHMRVKKTSQDAYTHLEHRPKVYEDHDAFFIKKEQL